MIVALIGNWEYCPKISPGFAECDSHLVPWYSSVCGGGEAFVGVAEGGVEWYFVFFAG